MNKYIVIIGCLLLGALLLLSTSNLFSHDDVNPKDVSVTKSTREPIMTSVSSDAVTLNADKKVTGDETKVENTGSAKLVTKSQIVELRDEKQDADSEVEKDKEVILHNENEEAQSDLGKLSKKERMEKAKENYDKLPERKKELFNRSREAAKNNEWGDFLNAVEDIYAENPRLILGSRYISQAIQYDAPVWVFERLLTYGEVFNYAHTLQLARSDKLGMALKLLPLGLDLHAKSTQGENGVHASTAGFRGYRILPLFLHHNVAAEEVIGGMDPLQYSLSKVTKTNKAFKFIKILIYEGKVAIKERHKEEVRKLALSHPDTYNRLITEIPEIEYALYKSD